MKDAVQIGTENAAVLCDGTVKDFDLCAGAADNMGKRLDRRPQDRFTHVYLVPFEPFGTPRRHLVTGDEKLGDRLMGLLGSQHDGDHIQQAEPFRLAGRESFHTVRVAHPPAEYLETATNAGDIPWKALDGREEPFSPEMLKIGYG